MFKSNFKKIISYIITIAMLFSLISGKGLVFAKENIDEGKCGLKAKYVLSADGTLTISGTGEITNTNWSSFKEQVKKVVIEDGIINIPDYAFSTHTNLSEVVMADSIQTIGTYAFRGCSLLNKVNIPKRMSELQNKMFEDCLSLTSIVIPDNIKKIGNEVFAGCTNLSSIQMSNCIEEVGEGILDNTAFYDNSENWIDNVLYCNNILVVAKSDIGGEVSVREGTRVIGKNAFYETKVTKIDLPKSMVRIGDYSFYNCDFLKEVVVSEGLKYIGYSAFYSNDLLSKIVLPDTVTEIGEKAFYSCVRLVDFYSPSSLTKIGTEAFSKCNTLESFTIPKGVAILGKNCFNGCDQLLELTSYSNAIPGSYYENATLNLPETVEKICAIPGSDYETYATKNKIEFEAIDDWSIYETENEYGKTLVSKNRREYTSSYEQNEKTYVDYANRENNIDVSVSGTENVTSYEIENILDGNTSTYWQSSSSASEIYVQIDLGKNIKFEKMMIWLFNTGLEYEISVSQDNIYYERAMYVTNPYANTRTDEICFNTNIEARYIKVKMLYEHFRPSDGIYEVAVYGVAGQAEKDEDVTTTTDIEITTTEPESSGNSNQDGETSTEPESSEDASNETTTELQDDGRKETTTPNESDITVKETTTGEEVSKNLVEIPSAVVIEFKTPRLKKIKEKDYHTARVKWTKSGEKCKYEIYRARKKNGKYKKIAVVSKTNYNDKKVKAGRKYFYKIKATYNGKSKMSKPKSIKIKGKPLRPSLKITTTNKFLKIKWGIISDNGKGIQIYVKSKHGGFAKYTKINETKKLKKSKKKKGVTGIKSSIDGLKKNTTYTFKARIYAIVKGKKVYSKWSKVKKIRIK